MKYSSNLIAFAVGPLLLLGAWVCNNHVTTSSAYAGGGIGALSSVRIDDFDAGTTLVNPSLVNAAGGGGSFSVTLINVTGAPAAPPFVLTGGVGAGGSQGAAHVHGTVSDVSATASTPSWHLTATLDPNSGKYDASAFRGVKFYYKVGAADDVTSRTFTVMLTSTGNGTDFSMPIVNVGTEWRECDMQFDLMTRPGWAYSGSPLTPPNLSGVNLQNMTGLMWAESRNGLYGVSNVDFWVDSVSFY
jgi:hypothetical protein